jgi:cytosine/uracil/thiamine/allantoin permease
MAEVIAGASSSDSNRTLFGPLMFSVFFAVVNIVVASLKYYTHRETLYWLVSPTLLLMAGFFIYRAIKTKSEVLSLYSVIAKQKDGETREVFVNLARSVVSNFSAAMYAIGTCMLLVSWC